MRINGTVLKAVGIAFILIGALLVARTLLFRNADQTAEAGETVQTVLEINQVEIPEFDQENGREFVLELNEGKPFFTDTEIGYAEMTGYFVSLSDCDNLSRAQSVIMCADAEHYNSGENTEDIAKLKPSGWKTNSIYQQTYLAMWELSGSADLKNLITGTEYMNEVVKPVEEGKVAAYVKEHAGTHVLYRVTPYYLGSDLVARGVLLEAYSLEDQGAFSMCEFIYNVQPGSEIEYEKGTYHQHESWEEALAK